MSLDVHFVRYTEGVTGGDLRVTFNVTFNLADMLTDVSKDHFPGGIWEELRRCGGEFAVNLSPAFKLALDDLRARRNELSAFNPSNGFGNVEVAETFLRRVLEACENLPDCSVEPCW